VGRGADAREANDALTRAGVAWEPPSNDEERAAALVLGTLAPLERAGLRHALEDLETHLEARTNPMVEDLDDSDPMAPLALLVRRFLPTITACDALASRRRAAPDGALVVAVGMQCDGSDAPDATAGVDCVPLWKVGRTDRMTERARFLEWPLAAAAVLGFADAASAERVTGALRARSRETASRIALVLTEADLAGHHDADAAEVRALATRVLGIARRDPAVDTRILELIAREPPPGPRRLPWLHLGAEEVLVVPKLGALADVDAFIHEVDGAANAGAAGAKAEWVRRPEAIR
jgi:hypothetical protein